ncbi:MAG: hypothetical protein JST26_03515 [Bacteroidetes bacterium]|nr:hypothetical protein [Bacteroidota bacterium]
MIKQILLSFIASCAFLQMVFSQNVAINSSGAAPAASAMLDIASSSSGLLIPRVALTAINSAGPVTSPATSLLVYNTATAGTGSTAVSPGYYYWDGAKWVSFGGTNGKDWSLTGNAGTTVASNFLGTTDANALAFRANNTERARIAATGEFVVGSTTPFSGDVFSAYGTYAINGYGSGTGSAGVYATSNSATGIAVWGTNSSTSGTGGGFTNNSTVSTLVNGSGVAGTGLTTGVYGYAATTAGGTTASGGYFGTAYSGTGTGGSSTPYAYVAARIGGTTYKIYGNGNVSTSVIDAKGKRAIMFCPEAPEVLFQDYGTGKLVNGRVHIDIDPTFSKNIAVNDKHPLRVFIQLRGDCKGVYVTNETATGFDVVELQGGTSNVEFYWNITANRKDEVDANGEGSLNQDLRFPEGPGPMEMKTIQKTEKR